ncbi:ABC transporter permease [Desulfolutivibrio sp.]|uniref:ABC transporter permease n=1 Tax=Desulfolutivibrio sp. TaxID=2773296 RepID=UPI002F96C462
MPLSLRIALSSLSTHKLRTVLAMLGVFLGALALTGVRHVSEAMVRKAEIETEKLGPNLLMAMSGKLRFSRGDSRTQPSHKNFKVSDALAIMRGLPSAARGVPYISKTEHIQAGNTRVACQLVATWPDYPQVRAFVPEFGRFFTQEEEDSRAMVCVLGRTIATRLFGDPHQAMGQRVYLYRAGLTVIGVMEEKGADLSGADQDEQVFVPLSTLMRRLANRWYISGVYIQLADGADFEAAKAASESILRRQHGVGPGTPRPDDFSVLTAKDTMRLKQQALDLVQTLGIISSSLSFAVGGLGILSIMVLLVRSRRMEIGIRRAVGARRMDIVRQFLIESGAMSCVGGAGGVLAALALLLVVYRFGDFPYVFDPWLILQALAGSAILGLAAGAYPAWQAGSVQILDVLRNKE